MLKKNSDLLRAMQEDHLRQRNLTATLVKITVGSWVGTIDCVLHAWRRSERTNVLACVSTHVALPRPQLPQDKNQDSSRSRSITFSERCWMKKEVCARLERADESTRRGRKHMRFRGFRVGEILFDKEAPS